MTTPIDITGRFVAYSQGLPIVIQPDDMGGRSFVPCFAHVLDVVWLVDNGIVFDTLSQLDDGDAFVARWYDADEFGVLAFVSGTSGGLHYIEVLPDDEPCYYILREDEPGPYDCALWWRPNSKGYTTNLDEAGLYPAAFATRLQRGGDRAVPRGVAQSLAQRHVSRDALCTKLLLLEKEQTP